MEKVEEHKKTEYSQDDLAKSIFKASQVSTNFRKAQTNKYKNLYKNNSNQAKLLESTFFPIGEENPGNIDIHNDISKLTHSFFAAAQKNSNNENKHGLVISRIDKKKVIEERKEGYLLKKNRFFFQKSRRRFCKIKNRKFLYYDTKKNNNALGCIDFDSLTISLNEVCFF